MISINEAYDLIMGSITLSEPKLVNISKSVGQVLRQAVVAEREQPPFNRVAMDGVALNLSAHDIASLRDKKLEIEGIQRAGRPQQTLKNEINVIEVMTGAPLPNGCNCVVRYEDVELHDGFIEFTSDATFLDMQNVHIRGSDFKESSTLLKPGRKILSPDVGVIVSQGLSNVLIGNDPKIAIISTGDELIDPGLRIEDHQIRRSNPYTLEAELNHQGFKESKLFHLPDNPEKMEEVLKSILNEFDFIVMSGGVSKGKFDFVPDTLAKLGVEKKFHKIKQRPGKPFWFGTTREGKGVFALPGNPVSSIFCLRRYVIPALCKYKGQLNYDEVEEVTLDTEVKFKNNLTYFYPVKIENIEGKLLAKGLEGNGSGDYFKISGSDGFVELSCDKDLFERGEIVKFYRWGVV
jgi:molybdopterin molybdotransferase